MAFIRLEKATVVPGTADQFVPSHFARYGAFAIATFDVFTTFVKSEFQ